MQGSICSHCKTHKTDVGPNILVKQYHEFYLFIKWRKKKPSKPCKITLSKRCNISFQHQTKLKYLIIPSSTKVNKNANLHTNVLHIGDISVSLNNEQGNSTINNVCSWKNWTVIAYKARETKLMGRKSSQRSTSWGFALPLTDLTNP